MSGRALTFALAAMFAAPAALADTAAVQRTWLERIAISAADKSCNLFSDGERLALQSGIYQAEGELLRADRLHVRFDERFGAGAVRHMSEVHLIDEGARAAAS